MKKVLVNVDVPNWAFDRIYHGLKKYCTQYSVHANYNCYLGNHNEFDIVVFLCDFHPGFLIDARIPKNKIVYCIRSDVFQRYKFYHTDEIKKYTNIVVASNNILLKKCQEIHDNVKLIPGGVDTDIFVPPTVHIMPQILRVGWSGSIDNFGKAMRGIDIIEHACDIASSRPDHFRYIFCPAIREQRWRTQDEMVTYYQNEIDVYVDMSEHAGRQNGLLEAGACESLLISTNAGIATSLIDNGINGYVIDRNVESLVDALIKIRYQLEFGKLIRKKIMKEWSWKVHAKMFEEIFDEVLQND